MKISRAMVGVVLALALLLTSCSGFPAVGAKTKWSGKVGKDDVQVTLGGVEVFFPADVAPPGTRAAVMIDNARQTPVPKSAEVMSDVVHVGFEGGIQPQVPVRIALPVREVPTESAVTSGEYLLAVSATSEDGTESFHEGALDAEAGTLSVEVDHLNDFKVVGVDVGAAFEEVKAVVVTGLGLEHPAPDCVGKKATVDEVKYRVASTAQTHLCVGESKGRLVVTAYPNTAMPFQVVSRPGAKAVTVATDTDPENLSLLTLAESVGMTDRKGIAGVFPGSQADLVFDGAPTLARLELKAESRLLLMAILAEVFDALDVVPVESFEQLQCLSDVFDSNSAVNEKLNDKSVGSLVKSAVSCAGTFAELTPWGSFLLATVSDDPAFLVTSVLGIAGEFTGENSYQVDLDVTTPRPPVNIRLGEGGALTLNGQRFGHGGPSEIAALTKALGEPDTTKQNPCRNYPMIERRWNNLVIYSLTKDVMVEPMIEPEIAGGISGWRFDSQLSSKQIPRVTIQGPNGIGFGTAGSTVKAKYASDGGFEVWSEGRNIEVFAGDSTNATFELDSNGRVKAMSAGWVC